MESLIHRIFFYQWQRKLVALLTATVVWIFVSHTIISTKIIPSVPIRVINLPADQTIIGILPNGFLNKRTTLTLTGTKDVMDQLEPGDLEIILDVSNLPNDGVVQIAKKDLVSLNPNFNLKKHILSVSHPEFAIKMSPILTEKISITLHLPEGSPPFGYEFLDIWPPTLTQTVSGPQEQVLSLKNQGLELTFNLNEITKEQLDALKGNGIYDDEVRFPVPEAWKKVHVPFYTRGSMPINDPHAKNLSINFLRQEFIPIKNDLPIHVFYPLKNSETINPETYALAPTPFIPLKNDIPILKLPLYASNVSKLFLDIVKDNIELEIVTAPPTEREKLEWGVGFIDSNHLEDTYAAFLLSNYKTETENPQQKNKGLENHFRQRFRLYVKNFTLYLSPEYKLELESRLESGKIRVHIPNASLITPQKTPNAD